MDPNIIDLRIMHALRHADPAAYSSETGTVYAVADTIPSDVLEAFEAMTPPIRYALVDDVWCLRTDDWRLFRDRLLSTLATRMAGRSLHLGFEGPTSDDLEGAPLLYPWAAIRDQQCGGAILLGMQSGHPTLRGRLINTSRLCGIAADHSWARTASRWYRLQELVEPEDLVDRLGYQVAGLEHLTLDALEVKAFVARDQIDAGVRDV